jgi:hypothetical protein
LSLDAHHRGPALCDALPGTSTNEFVNRIGELMSTSRVGDMRPVTWVLPRCSTTISPIEHLDVLWARSVRGYIPISAKSPVPLLPCYQCYTEAEHHSGLLASIADGRARPATFDSLYAPESRDLDLAAEPRSTVDAACWR